MSILEVTFNKYILWKAENLVSNEFKDEYCNFEYVSLRKISIHRVGLEIYKNIMIIGNNGIV